MKDKQTAMKTGMHRIATLKDLMVYLLIGWGAVALLAIWYAFIPVGKWIAVTVLPALYVFAVVWFTVYRLRRERATPDHSLSQLLVSPLGTWVARLDSPLLICDQKGILVWYNDKAVQTIGADKIEQGTDITPLLPLHDPQKRVTLGEGSFSVSALPVDSGERGYLFLTLHDHTELKLANQKYYDDRAAVGFISIDNVQEVNQYAQDKTNDAILEVDNKLKKWAIKTNAILRQYDNDKYIMLLETKHVTACMEDRFSILDEIRSTRVGDGISMTVSMGIARVGGSLAERERAAMMAHELAMQRGGDQVVYKTDDGLEFYGGRTRSVYKRTNVKARVFATQLCAEIARAGHVLIMGHRWADHDSFGASIGMAKFARMCGTKVNIVLNKKDQNITESLKMALAMDEYKDIFIKDSKAASLVTKDTLLLIVDVNNFEHLEAPELVPLAGSVVVIDHHIQPAELPSVVKLAHIDPSASSASELVTEFLEFGLNVRGLRKEEAELLYAGIILDTKQFSRNTGPRTFAAAQFLRGQGAGSAEAIDLYRSELDDLTKEARFFGNVILYRDHIAIAYCQDNTDATYRVIAAKAADKLLDVKQVDASFALVSIEDTIHISARSSGKINVQLILEGLRGGGHFDAAGAQLPAMPMKDAVALLKDGIDKYIDQRE
ncbi:MAG: DHH family phosphoesterase [Eubacteriales bacterium]